MQSNHEEHEQCTENEDSDYELNESYFAALRNQLRRDEYLKVYIIIATYTTSYVCLLS